LGFKQTLMEMFLRVYVRLVLRSKSKIAASLASKILDFNLRPDQFDRERYVVARGKELLEGVNPEIHALIWGVRQGFHGLYRENERDLQNRKRHSFQSLERNLGVEVAEKMKKVPTELPIVLVVTHDLSRTGAPILALNLVAEFSKTNFVISVSLGDGELKDNFESLSGLHFSLDDREKNFSSVLDRICEINRPRAVFINSIVSSRCVEATNRNGLPSILLIHEFLSYSKIKPGMREAINQATTIVFSSKIVLKDYEQSRLLDQESIRKSVVIHQGISAIPQHGDYRKSVDYNFQEKIDYLLSSPHIDAPQLVVGVGSVQFRKGVDLFIEVARQVRSKPGLENTVFAWIGDGYDPYMDYAYSVYLNDQIYRSSLRRHLKIIDSSSSVRYAIDRCSVFCLTSRLDPLPNVALDAISAGKPISYFDKASGLSELFESFPVMNAGEVPYLDVTMMAENVSGFLRTLKNGGSSKTSEEIKVFARTRLRFEKYSSDLLELI